MKITVEYTAHLKRAVGAAVETVEIRENCAISELMEAVLSLHPDELRDQILTADGHPNPSIVIAVNGEQVYPDSDRLLNDGDTVVLLAAIAGG